MSTHAPDPRSSPRVHVVDGDDAFRTALCWLFRVHELDCEGYASAVEFLAALAPAQPGCVILDTGIPDAECPGLLDHLRAEGHVLPVICTGTSGVQAAVDAIKRGAFDFLPKPCEPECMLEAVRKALVFDAWQRRQHEETAEMMGRFQSLTPRERQILDGIAQGKSSKEIGRALGISPRTVDTRRMHIRQKLNAHNLAELVHIHQACQGCPPPLTAPHAR